MWTILFAKLVFFSELDFWKLLTLTNLKIESKIQKIEKEIKNLDVELATNYDKTVENPDFFTMYNGKKNELERFNDYLYQVKEQIEIYKNNVYVEEHHYDRNINFMRELCNKYYNNANDYYGV